MNLQAERERQKKKSRFSTIQNEPSWWLGNTFYHITYLELAQVSVVPSMPTPQRLAQSQRECTGMGRKRMERILSSSGWPSPFLCDRCTFARDQVCLERHHQRLGYLWSSERGCRGQKISVFCCTEISSGFLFVLKFQLHSLEVRNMVCGGLFSTVAYATT